MTEQIRPEINQFESIATRYPQIISSRDYLKNDLFLRALKEKGYTKESLIEQAREKDFSSPMFFGDPYLSGGIEREILTNTNSVGVEEPTMAELIGPEEIVKLRGLEKPKFLLVGSHGKYSAEEYAKFLQKLNHGAKAVVADIDQENIPFYLRAEKNSAEFTIADGKELAFKDESFHVVATNYLLHMFQDLEGKEDLTPDRIREFFKEAARVIKKDGALVMVEQDYRSQYDRNPDQSLLRVMEEAAKSAGLRLDKQIKDLAFCFREDAGSLAIDERGQGRTDKLLVQDDTGLIIAVKFVKV